LPRVAGWYPDPSRRNDWRYWDGLRWTEHVYVQGRAREDPILVGSFQEPGGRPLQSAPSPTGGAIPPLLGLGLIKRTTWHESAIVVLVIFSGLALLILLLVLAIG